MSRRRQVKKRGRMKKKSVKKKDPIKEMSNKELCLVRNQGDWDAELARETLISRDPRLAKKLTDATIDEAMISYFEKEHTYGDIECWDVSNVTDMNSMFSSCYEFNADLSKWTVSNVTDMEGMFYDCQEFNADLSKWNVSKVTNMDYMFIYCYKFNSDLSAWDVRNVTDTEGMFH